MLCDMVALFLTARRVEHKQVVADLVALDAANAARAYTTCARLVHKLLASVHHAPRRRDISYIAALVRGGHDACDELSLEFTRNMSRETLEDIKQDPTVAGIDKVRATVKAHAPHLLALANTTWLVKNGEFRRVLFMVAV